MPGLESGGDLQPNEPDGGWFRYWWRCDQWLHLARWANAARDSLVVSSLMPNDAVRSMSITVDHLSEIFESRVNGSNGWSSRAARRCVRRVCDALAWSCIAGVRRERSATKTEEEYRAFFKVECLKVSKSLLQLQPSQFELTSTLTLALHRIRVFLTVRRTKRVCAPVGGPVSVPLPTVSLSSAVSAPVCSFTPFSSEQGSAAAVVGGVVAKASIVGPLEDERCDV
jgi:hypothetical protein